MNIKYFKYINTAFVVIPMTLIMAFVGLIRNYGFGEDWFFKFIKAYTILHTRHNGGMFAGVDLATERGKADILNAIDQIIGMAFAAEDKRSHDIVDII